MLIIKLPKYCHYENLPGVLRVIVIIRGNRISDLSSNPHKAVYISLWTDALGKGMNPHGLPSPNYGKQSGRLGSLTLVR